MAAQNMIENNPLISVIILIYNVERYLRECVDSVLKQTYTNLEIILVDDGSPDGCPQICDEYAGSDSRVKVIHKPNGGLSDARNAGIDIAQGELLTLVDGDDWITNDMIESLYRNLENEDVGMSCCGHFWSYVGEDIPHTSKPPWNVTILTGEQAMRSVLSGRLSNTSCGKLYRKFIFDSIRFPIGKIMAQDAWIVPDVFAAAGSVAVNPAPKYYYRRRKSSVTNSTKEKARIALKLDMLENRQRSIEELFPELAEQSKARLYRMYIRAAELILSDGNYRKESADYEVMSSILHKIKDNAGQLMKNPHFKKADKRKLRLLKTSTGLYKAAMSLKRVFKRGEDINNSNIEQDGKILFD